MDETWTVFFLEAEYDHYGMKRIVDWHNDLLNRVRELEEEVTSLKTELEVNRHGL